MRYFIVSFFAWGLMVAGAVFFVRGGMEYWEAQHGQTEIAAQWQREQPPPMEPKQNNAAPEPEAASGSVGPESSEDSAHELSRAPNAPQMIPESPRLEPSPARSPKKGDAVARLSIPRLNAVLYIVEGTDEHDLRRGPGHVEGSVLPGQDGNCIIAGHRDTHFLVLRNVHKGDEIILERSGQKYVYRVDELSVTSPDNTNSLRSTRDAVLNLITCFPFQYVGSAPKRFIVHAELEKPALRAAG